MEDDLYDTRKKYVEGRGVGCDDTASEFLKIRGFELFTERALTDQEFDFVTFMNDLDYLSLLEYLFCEIKDLREEIQELKNGMD